MRQVQRVRQLFFSFCVITLVAACSNLLNPAEWERVVGLIDIGDFSPPPVQPPQTVRKGVSFKVAVITYGSSSCTRPDGADVRISGLTAEITPYDLELKGEDVICTADLRAFSRDVTLRFDEVGEATIRVLGRGFEGPTKYEAGIAVQP